MGLKKPVITTVTRMEEDRRQRRRSYSGLLEELRSESVQERRWAARDLAVFPQAVGDLLNALEREPEHVVREALFDSLQHLGGEAVARGLIASLRSEDADLRNGAIEVLQSLPEMVAPHILNLLNDPDSDVRIFAIDILQQLAHPETPLWLLSILKEERHVNVVATALDRLAEVGTPEMIPELEMVRDRFPEEPFIEFVVSAAIRRIQGM